MHHKYLPPILLKEKLWPQVLGEIPVATMSLCSIYISTLRKTSEIQDCFYEYIDFWNNKKMIHVHP